MIRSILLFCILITSYVSADQMAAPEVLSPIAAEVKGLYDIPKFKKRTEIKNTLIKYLLNAIDKVKALESKTGFFDKTWNHLFYTAWLGFLVEPNFSEGLILLSQEQAPKLHACVENLCKRLAIPKPMIFLARDKEFFNAAANSFTHHLSCVIISEPLLNKLTEPELNNLLAHELAHIKHHHTVKRMGLSLGLLASSIIVPFVMYHYMTRNEKPLIDIKVTEGQRPSKKFAAGAAMVSAVVLLFCAVIMPILISRSQEKEADMTALEATQDSVGFVGLWQKFEDHFQEDFNCFSEEYRFFLEYLEKLGENQGWAKATIKYLADAAFQQEQIKLKMLKEEEPPLATHPSFKTRKEYGAAFNKKEAVQALSQQQ